MMHEIENKAMQLLLAGDYPMLTELREQYSKSRITSIKLTGVGAYINYAVPATAANLPQTLNFCFGDIEGQISSIQHGIGFLLWVKSGLLSSLEMYTYDELWPEEITGFHLSYVGGERNITDLKESWQPRLPESL